MSRNYIGLCQKYFPGRVERFIKDGQSPPERYTWHNRGDIGSFVAAPGKTVPTVSEIKAKESDYDAFIANEIANAPKTQIEMEIRSNLIEMAKVKRMAKAEGKAVDDLIAEIVAEA